MTKRVFILMGIAILFAVWSHAAGFGQIAMFNWTDRYRPVTVPNFDQIGTPSYYVLLVIRQLAVWCVPAFLFISGFFASYAAGGSRSRLSWRAVRARITNLLVPYIIWSSMIFLGDALDGIRYTPLGYLQRLALGRAVGPYYYVPLLCQFYLIAPLMTAVAGTRGGLLLLVSALIQLGALASQYLDLFGIGLPGLHLSGAALPQLPIWWAFYFPLGVVFRPYARQLKPWLAQRKWRLLGVLAVLGVLVIVEPEVIYRITGRDWRFVPFTISSMLYSVAFILCFLAFDGVRIPFSRVVHQIGRRSYPIYLLHMTTMQFIARVIRHIAPWVLAYQVVVFMPLMLAVGLAVPLFFIASVARTPARPYSRYLFG